ncbi:DUF397 domain-containing protein [Streptomyces sp. NPDC086091]|uniref:DUF397 domain-containing protein n=1 Tax=Streptomyces sp. NPDC086091 TaxID=3365751 RepID=UPI00381D7661
MSEASTSTVSASPSGLPPSWGPGWFTSSYSNGAGGECLACASTGSVAGRGRGVLVRDSKDAHGPVVDFGAAAWLGFVRDVRRSAPPR